MRRGGRFAAGAGLLALFFATLAPAFAHHAGGFPAAAAVPGHHLPDGFRNVDPGWARGSSWVRVHHFLRRLGATLRGEPRVAALPATAADAGGLRKNGQQPGETRHW